MEREAVICNQCGQPYSVRVRDDGSFILPTDDGVCGNCGGGDFSELAGRMDDDRALDD